MPPARLWLSLCALLAVVTSSAVAFASEQPADQRADRHSRFQTQLPMRAMVGQVARDIEHDAAPEARVPVAPAGPPSPRPQAPSANTVYSEADMDLLLELVGWPPEHRAAAKAVAWCESNWRTDATGPLGTRGLFQIHPVHGALSSYDPLINAQAALALSSGGTDWSPWYGCTP